MAIIRVENLSRVFVQGQVTVPVLTGLNLALDPGAFAAVMGPSGSGKTTLLNIIGGLDRPTGGRVTVNGVDIAALPEKRLHTVRREMTGFVFQLHYLIPTLNALENVLVPTVPWGGNKRVLKQRAGELLDLVGLAEKAARRPGRLSGGEQQRVAIARALILDPPILLADEPTAHLDAATGQKIVALLGRLCQELGKTILVATHDRAVGDACGEVVALGNGRCVHRGGKAGWPGSSNGGPAPERAFP